MPYASVYLQFCLSYMKLNKLDLLEPLVGQVLTSLIYTTIENHVQKTCKDSFDSSYLTTLETWLETVIIPWLQTIYCSEYASVNEEAVKRFQRKLLNFLYETYAKVRINQLFNIIIEFPESLPALEDLRLCLQKTDLRSVLIEKLQKSMETRLLHPGVSTPDILTAYVASIRSMRVLDPSGLLLETVTQPVHQYLRSRDDTVRCVVSSLTEEDPNDLAEELVRGNAVHVDENALSDEDAENWTKWMPDPVEADPNKSSNIRRSSDIISMLVSVYGSKELFVNEYRTLLADRLLSQFSCDTEKEIRYLELLKLRFGDSQLHYCEVMLKDVADSKRIKTHIAQIPEYSENFNMSAMILSAQFWPALKDEKLEVHPKIKEQMALYTKGFEALKGSRTLAWKNHLGVVDVEIDLPDRKLNLSVTPVHVTIIMHFEDKKEWALDELSRVMQVPPTILRRKMGFWQSYGLIEEVKPDLFCLIEEIENSVSKAASEIVEDYESESAMASAQDQRKEELQTFWSYITGMLMNLDSLPLERIHQMLKMFAFQGPTIECSLQELRHFLDAKVREHELVYSGGLYKLPKSDILT
ncbi:anaphase-promoting complex subunit 2 isoform X2 [Agrilus planipennis]|uniref:Anaphase-promoting complex subunit 2 n=1 Tax=Agrilus planipennis TaxID=224129 RepID=A0A1W4XL28_AGRPL|nr:anaphase-promoting complex subunit 2 isoform X2 [Agrilus planipennis]